MIIGTLALTGFPFLSGFYSKDAIIEFAYLKRKYTGYYAAGIGIFTAFLTSIYSWRLIFKTFHGEYNNKNINIEETHESPLVMLIPCYFTIGQYLLVIYLKNYLLVMVEIIIFGQIQLIFRTFKLLNIHLCGFYF